MASSLRTKYENAKIEVVGRQKYLYQNVFGEEIGKKVTEVAKSFNVDNIQKNVKKLISK